MGLVEVAQAPLESAPHLPPMTDRELIQQQAEWGLQDIYYFETEILQVGKEDELPRAEHEIRPLLEWFDQPRPKNLPKTRRHLIYWSSPRFTAKTFCLAAVLCRKIIINPNIAIMLMCELKWMATKTIELIANWLESPRVVQCYGRFRGPKGWGKEELTVCQGTSIKRDPTIWATGLEVPTQGGHPNVIVWDDLVGEETNDLMGFKKVDDKVAACMPVLRQDGIGIFNGTRWGEDDPAGKILVKAAEGKQWVAPPGRGFFGAYAVDGDKEFFKEFKGEVGDPLFPGILPDEEIKHYAEIWPPELFSSQILNDPTPAESRYFNSDNYQYFEPYKKDSLHLIDELAEGLPYMALDAAGGKETLSRGDDSVMGVGFGRWVGPTPQLWMVDAVGGRFKVDDVIKHFFILLKKWKPVKVFIETNMAKDWLLDPILKRAQMEGIRVPYEEVNWGRGDAKRDRIQALVTPYQYGQIFHAKNLKSSKLEIQELKWKPGGKVHDDWPDMMAMIWLKGMGKMKRKRKPGQGFKVGSFNKGRTIYPHSRV